jgi:hypothetical protein
MDKWILIEHETEEDTYWKIEFSAKNYNKTHITKVSYSSNTTDNDDSFYFKSNLTSMYVIKV